MVPSSDAVERLHAVCIHILRGVRAADEASGLTPSRLSALSVIVFAGPISLKALAKAEQVSAPTMNRLVDALMKLRLVKVRESDRDARSIDISATAKGKRLLLAGRERRLAVLRSALATLAPEEQRALESALIPLERVAAGVKNGNVR